MCELKKQSFSAMDEILNYLYIDVHTRLKPNVPLGLDDALTASITFLITLREAVSS